MSDEKPNDSELAKRLFGHLKPDEIPSVERVLRALQVAKGVKFQLNPEKLQALRTREQEPIHALQCPTDTDICILCDSPRDLCKLCDTLDCGPTYRDVD
ncbi:freyrasin family ranthipeptide [Corallococcus carmarthensis]|uniref:Uncharacterized protein n=1 Tax=Corallococcus carmarthensis TaxID=2316728 RepID=A0A3A8JZY5_9BACT|nr:freyrasin family ranthipeptide [Corallococcus carmarthensis]NOK19563.1 freyrasin family ranthipeptide [Corallococcus carmarthensis]RKH01568.1 hypothetical protein D7X32_19845 [Corallococcus carmarthensis]